MLTVNQLGITQAELEALLWTRQQLVDHAINGNGNKFDMNYPSKNYHCGTSGCIGGWMKIHMLEVAPDDKGVFRLDPHEESVVDSYVNTSRSRTLGPLFYPALPDDHPLRTEWERITPAHGVQAIDNFLNTGDPNWIGVLQDVAEYAEEEF
jgi:hypothetical protein